MVQACPWSSSTVLVVDSGNSRVVEVDVQQGLVVKVGYLSGMYDPRFRSHSRKDGT